MSVCVYPGSFDPITVGHLDIIRRAAKQYDKVIVAALVNSKKKPFFSVEERLDLIRESCVDLPQVEVASFEGLTVEFAKKNGAAVIVRGLRAAMDFEYEFQLATLNRMLDCDIETVFLMTSTQYQFISSSMAKEIALLGGDYRFMIPEGIYERVEAAFSQKRRNFS